ncbi:BglG family transcription antiterminator [Virgibacillus chiguensis]|uniref:Ascorbate-specific PTS system EIIA component n=1 Tax=Virgibacillus chiguensis TaxID=411959 RepID=A0A1M5S0A0_9BACI|nr:BglG family transcription antiterminator [Virgibacillus chiguensis]SHH31910.1 PTS system, ascorbate-specific IIA component [Virgibacillus chiguensis]
MFDQRSFKLFEEIITHDEITVSQLIRKLDVSERQFNYDLEKVNNTLKSMKLEPIKLHDQQFVVDAKVKDLLQAGAPLDISMHHIVLSEEERIYLLYLYTFIRKEPVSNYHYQQLLYVSKNTALSDVKKAKKLCQKKGVILQYSRKDGYHLTGTEMEKRRLASFCINYLLTKSLGKEMLVLVLKSWKQEGYYVNTQLTVNDVLKVKQIHLVKDRKAEVIFHLTFIRVRTANIEPLFSQEEKQLLRSQRLFGLVEELARRLFENNQLEEQYYLTLQLLIALQEVKLEENPYLSRLTMQIIEAFEKNTLLPIDNKTFLQKSLYNHLVPAFYRIIFEIPLVNPLTSQIKQKYVELFQFVKRSLAPLSDWTKKPISDEEIGYFTLHFGGYLEKNRNRNKTEIHGLIVCSNGVSSSIMLRAQLKEMFPNIHFSRVHTAEQVSLLPTSSYDLIFTTVDVDSPKPIFTVKPLLSKIEKNYLIESVMNQFPILNNYDFSMDQIMEVIAKHTEIKDEKRLFSDLVDLIHLSHTDIGGYKPMLSELLTEEMIQFTDEPLSWKEAIEMAAQPLLAAHKIRPEYIEAMNKKVEEVGTYIHIGKGIAIPHARPEEGVVHLGMSFLRTNTPVKLLGKDDHQIDVFICLAAVDNEAHLKALSHLTKLLSDNAILQALKAAQTAQEVMEIIK